MVDKITSHVDDQKNRLLYQFRQVEAATLRLTDLVGIDGSHVQEIEDLFYSLIGGRALPTATGASLSLIGDLVGQPRPTSGAASTDDDVYRAQIYGRIAANTSEGLREDVLSILSAIGAGNVVLNDVYPAAAVVSYNNTNVVLDVDAVKELLILATAPIEWNVSTFTDQPFGFTDDPSAFGYDDSENIGVASAGEIGSA